MKKLKLFSLIMAILCLTAFVFTSCDLASIRGNENNTEVPEETSKQNNGYQSNKNNSNNDDDDDDDDEETGTESEHGEIISAKNQNGNYTVYYEDGLAAIVGIIIKTNNNQPNTSGIDFFELLSDGTCGVAVSESLSLSIIEIPQTYQGKKVTQILPMGFKDASGLYSISIPDGVKKISTSAFAGCTSLTNIQIPKSVTYIHPSAFDGCYSLNSIDYDGTVEEAKKLFASFNIDIICSDGTYIPVKPVEYEVVPYDGSEVTITFYHTMGQSLRDVLDKYIIEFNEMYPNIKIVHSQEGGYDDVRDKIKTELVRGEQPNITYCYPDHVALYNVANAVVPLNSFINSTEEITNAYGSTTTFGLTSDQIADFIPGFYAEGAAFDDQGTMYTLPMSKSTEVLYYNKTFFDQHGLKVPTTWDEMEAVCAQIKAIDPSCIPLGYDSESNWFINMCAQYNSPYTSAIGEPFLFDNETNRAFVKRFAEWYSKGYVTTQEIYGAYTSGLFVEQSAGWTKSYMSIGSSAGATHQRPKTNDKGEYPFEVGIVPIPQVDPSNPKAISLGPSLCILDNADKQEVAASWLFVKFLTTCIEFQAEFSMTAGYIPVIKSASEHPAYQAFLERANGTDYITALSFKTCMEMADYYFVPPAFNGSSVARDQVGNLLIKCMTEYKTASDKDGMIADAFVDAVNECEKMS